MEGSTALAICDPSVVMNWTFWIQRKALRGPSAGAGEASSSCCQHRRDGERRPVDFRSTSHVSDDGNMGPVLAAEGFAFRRESGFNTRARRTPVRARATRSRGHGPGRAARVARSVSPKPSNDVALRRGAAVRERSDPLGIDREGRARPAVDRQRGGPYRPHGLPAGTQGFPQGRRAPPPARCVVSPIAPRSHADRFPGRTGRCRRRRRAGAGSAAPRRS